VLRAGYGLDPDDDAARELAQALIDYKQFTMRPHPRFRLDEFDAGPFKLLDTPWILIVIVGMMRRTNAVHQAARRVVARRRVRKGEMVPAGEQAMILLHVLHHHPDFWDDPDRFESRKCIGRAMVEMHFLAVVSAIVRRFDVSVFAEPVSSSSPVSATPSPFRSTFRRSP
jgi:cytochrome P450